LSIKQKKPIISARVKGGDQIRIYAVFFLLIGITFAEGLHNARIAFDTGLPVYAAKEALKRLF